MQKYTDQVRQRSPSIRPGPRRQLVVLAADRLIHCGLRFGVEGLEIAVRAPADRQRNAAGDATSVRHLVKSQIGCAFHHPAALADRATLRNVRVCHVATPTGQRPLRQCRRTHEGGGVSYITDMSVSAWTYRSQTRWPFERVRKASVTDHRAHALVAPSRVAASAASRGRCARRRVPADGALDR